MKIWGGLVFFIIIVAIMAYLNSDKIFHSKGMVKLYEPVQKLDLNQTRGDIASH